MKMFCKSRRFVSFSIASSAVVLQKCYDASITATHFKSLASTNFAMPARLVFARLFALTSTNVLQLNPRVLQNWFASRSGRAA